MIVGVADDHLHAHTNASAADLPTDRFGVGDQPFSRRRGHLPVSEGDHLVDEGLQGVAGDVGALSLDGTKGGVELGDEAPLRALALPAADRMQVEAVLDGRLG